jgi:hypothetical protein
MRTGHTCDGSQNRGRHASGNPKWNETLDGSGLWNGSSAVLVDSTENFAVAISANQEFQQPLTLANDIDNLWRIPR